MSQSETAFRSQLRTPRAAAIAGIIFSVLLGMAIILMSSSVTSDQSEAERWLTDPGRRTSVRVALNLVPFAGIAFLWFIGVIRDRIGQREDRLFATVFLGSGLLFVGMLFVAAAAAGGLISDPALASGRFFPSELWDLERRITFTILNVYAIRMGGVFILSTTTIGRRAGVIPRWLVAVGVAAALILLVGSGLSRWVSLVLPVWAFILSIHILLRSAEVERGTGDVAIEPPDS
jgi:hypothetical protein